jgi:hypothetical protein
VLAFETFVNGVRVGTVGFPRNGVTGVHIDHTAGFFAARTVFATRLGARRHRR